jgi:Arc/MetJ-type ribon-helix-helix transcriptional regulator
MQVELKNSQLEAFIDNQVRAGRFPSPHAAVEAAVEQMRISMEHLDDETIAAIARADDQYARGEYVEWRAVREQMRAKNAVV